MRLPGWIRTTTSIVASAALGAAALTGAAIAGPATVAMADDPVLTNIAPAAAGTTASASRTEYSSSTEIDRTRDGDRAGDAWSNWGTGYTDPVTLTYEFDKVYSLASTQIFFQKDGADNTWADVMSVQYETAGGDWLDVPAAAWDQATVLTPAPGSDVPAPQITFAGGLPAVGLRYVLTNTHDLWLKVSEVEIFAPVTADVPAWGIVGTALAGSTSLPSTIRHDGAVVPVTWDGLTAQDLSNVYRLVPVSGTATIGGAPTPFTGKLFVIPANLVYFIDSGSVGTASDPAYEAVKAAVPSLANAAADAVSTGSTWGYDAGNVSIQPKSNADDPWSGGLYVTTKGDETPIRYYLPLSAGTYTVDAAVYEWWSGPRFFKGVVKAGGATIAESDDASVGAANRSLVLPTTFTLTSDTVVTYELTHRTGSGTNTETPQIAFLSVASTAPRRSVSFDLQGHGATVPPQSVVDGGTVTPPNAPTAAGWTFGGWYTDAATTHAYDFATPVTADVTLYARWTALPSYAVSFDLGGHGAAVPSQTVLQGASATRPTDPTATGWTFDGWYSDAARTQGYDFATPVAGAVTLYARWTQVTYPVTFDLGGHGTEVPALIVNHGGTVAKPADPEAAGWVFEGWYSDAARTQVYDFAAPMTAARTIYAKWSQDTTEVSAALGASIAQAAALQQAQYTPSSWTAFAAALSAAQATVADPSASFSDLEGARDALEAARVALVPVTKKPEGPSKPGVPVSPVPAAAVRVKAAQVSVTVVKGRSVKVPAFAYTADGSRVKVTYESSKAKVAKVTKAGKITGKKVGRAKVTVKAANGKKVTIKVRVVAKKTAKVKVKKVTVKVPGSLRVGQVVWVTAKFAPASAAGAVVSYKSSKPGVVSVDKAGRLVAKAAGKAQLVVKVGKKTKKTTLTVR